ncbi:MAG TPA: GDCCVxC domain-containing (seleno)protein [Saprospiraceae bacterium]|nr:GDCCVxC domain-containing (seleno)protein [Saprospiraceae bacterium]
MLCQVKQQEIVVDRMNVVVQSTITCPSCGIQKTENMPTDACLHFYVCDRCSSILKPKPGDCCVFCSYGDIKCPPKQQEMIT